MKKVVCFLIVLMAPNVWGLEFLRQKGVATHIVFPIVDVNDNRVSGAAGLDSEIAPYSDSAAPTGFVDCTYEATEIGSSGWYDLALTAAEMNADYFPINITSTTPNVREQRLVVRTQIGKPANTSTTASGVEIQMTGYYVKTDVQALQGGDPSNLTDFITYGYNATNHGVNIDTIRGEDPGTISDVTGGVTVADAVTSIKGPDGDNLTGLSDQLDVVGSGDATEAKQDTIISYVDSLESRLTTDRAGYLDKLNVPGTLAHSEDAGTYKADVSGLAGTLSTVAGQTANIGDPNNGTLAQDIADVKDHLNSGTVSANLTALGGSSQSALDLKDCADNGYDPANHGMNIWTVRGEAPGRVSDVTGGTSVADAVTSIKGPDGDNLKGLSDQIDGIPDAVLDESYSQHISGSAVGGLIYNTWLKIGSPNDISISQDLADIKTHLDDRVDVAISTRSSHSATDVTGGTTISEAVTSIKGPDGDNLKGLSDQIDAVPTNTMSLGAIIDGSVTVKDLWEMMLAFFAGKVTIEDEGATSTITYYKRDNTTVKYTITSNDRSGARVTAGSINP